MRRLPSLIVAIVLVQAMAAGQTTPRTYTQPGLPPADVLDKLNLSLAWRSYLPVEGYKDGIHSFQMAPWDKYQLRPSAFTKMRARGVPNTVIEKLKLMHDRRFFTDLDFCAYLDRIVTPDEWKRHASVVLQLAHVPSHQLLVQMRSGTVLMLDAETGEVHWRNNRLGPSFNVTVPPGFNMESVFVPSGPRMYVLDRWSGQLQWQYDFPSTIVSAPVADGTDPALGERLYLCVSGVRLYAYKLPPLERRIELPGPPAPEPKPELDEIAMKRFRGDLGGNEILNRRPTVPAEPVVNEPRRPAVFARGQYTGPDIQQSYILRPETDRKPILQWNHKLSVDPEQIARRNLWYYNDKVPVDFLPLVGQRVVTVLAGEGHMFSAFKRADPSIEHFRVPFTLVAPPTQYRDNVYASSNDGTVYAFNVEPNYYGKQARIFWHFSTGGQLAGRPKVSDKDVYVAAAGRGLYRFARQPDPHRTEVGVEQWRNPDMARFVAASSRFVYAMDKSNRLAVLDGKRGTALGSLDARDFNVPLDNEATDRVYLSAHDGLLACLRDRAHPEPVVNRTWVRPIIGNVVQYENNSHIVIESMAEGGGVKETKLSVIRGFTYLSLERNETGIKPGAVVVVYPREASTTAARIYVRGPGERAPGAAKPDGEMKKD